MIKPIEASHKIGEEIAKKIDNGYKYYKLKLALIKKYEWGFNAIYIDVIPTSHPKEKMLSVVAQIRLNGIEEI